MHSSHHMGSPGRLQLFLLFSKHSHHSNMQNCRVSLIVLKSLNDWRSPGELGDFGMKFEDGGCPAWTMHTVWAYRLKYTGIYGGFTFHIYVQVNPTGIAYDVTVHLTTCEEIEFPRRHWQWKTMGCCKCSISLPERHRLREYNQGVYAFSVIWFYNWKI